MRKDTVTEEETKEETSESEVTETEGASTETKGKRKIKKKRMPYQKKDKGWANRRAGAASRGREEFTRNDKREAFVQKVNERDDIENPFEEMDWDRKKSSALYFYYEKIKV